MDICAALGLKWPIFQAPMAGVSTPEMAAAVSNAGGLGALGLGAAGIDGAREMIRATRALTDRPFNANFFCHEDAVRDAACEAEWLAALTPEFERFGAEPPDELREIYKTFVSDQDMFEMVLDEAPGVVSLHFGLISKDWIAQLQSAGNLVFASVTCIAEAKAAVDASVDAVVAQGIEAGGHRGVFDPQAADEALSTSDLVIQLCRDVEIPVVAAGGIMDGGEVAKMLELGAGAAQLGTAFLDCDESLADRAYRAALRAPECHPPTMTSAVSGRPARCLRNRFVKLGETTDLAVPAYPVAYDAAKALHAAAKGHGEGGFGAHWAGRSVAKVRRGSAREILREIGAELVDQ